VINLFLKIISLAGTILLLASCGNKNTSKKEKEEINSRVDRDEEEVVIPPDDPNIVGHFQAKFITLNPHVNGTIPGSANFYRKEEKLFAYVRLFAGGVRAWHMQNIYTGNRCPDISDDLNSDGFLDINETEAVIGKILIPLDSDIRSQNSGRRFFPLADLSGYYHYERITNFELFLRDLQAEDKDPTDDVVKLPPGQGLNLKGKVVLIQGLSETVQLPETVGTKGKFKSFQTLPIACGVFGKVETLPGSPYVTDQIPGPIGEVIEGQDRPADDEMPESNDDSDDPTGGTNESDDGDGPVSDGDGNTEDWPSEEPEDDTEVDPTEEPENETEDDPTENTEGETEDDPEETSDRDNDTETEK
jgi:hypothetical protein